MKKIMSEYNVTIKRNGDNGMALTEVNYTEYDREGRVTYKSKTKQEGVYVIQDSRRMYYNVDSGLLKKEVIKVSNAKWDLNRKVIKTYVYDCDNNNRLYEMQILRIDFNRNNEETKTLVCYDYDEQGRILSEHEIDGKETVKLKEYSYTDDGTMIVTKRDGEKEYYRNGKLIKVEDKTLSFVEESFYEEDKLIKKIRTTENLITTEYYEYTGNILLSKRTEVMLNNTDNNKHKVLHKTVYQYCFYWGIKPLLEEVCTYNSNKLLGNALEEVTEYEYEFYED